jgi:hypothetical protein
VAEADGTTVCARGAAAGHQARQHRRHSHARSAVVGRDSHRLGWQHDPGPAQGSRGRGSTVDLALVYGRGGDARAPEIESALLSPDRAAVDLVFAHVPNRLAFLGPGEHDFVVEDFEGFVPVRTAATPARDRVRLELERPAVGEVRVHGGYGANPPCHLRDAEENMPVLGFYGVTATVVET